MKHASFRPYGEALSKPIGRIGLLFMLACCSAWTGCRRPDRPSSVSERLQERKWIVQFPGPKDYSCEMRFTATERIVTLVYMGRHESPHGTSFKGMGLAQNMINVTITAI